MTFKVGIQSKGHREVNEMMTQTVNA